MTGERLLGPAHPADGIQGLQFGAGGTEVDGGSMVIAGQGLVGRIQTRRAALGADGRREGEGHHQPIIAFQGSGDCG